MFDGPISTYLACFTGRKALEMLTPSRPWVALMISSYVLLYACATSVMRGVSRPLFDSESEDILFAGKDSPMMGKPDQKCEHCGNCL
jgi:hypothetical protein